MAKKPSALSRQAKLKRVKAEDIFSEPLNGNEKQILRRHAVRQSAGDDARINFADIPPMTEEQLAQMIRFRDRPRKIAVSVRLDANVLEWLKSKGKGHLTRINDILANVMEAERDVRQKH